MFMMRSVILEESFPQKLSHHLKSTLFSLLQILKQLGLILHSLRISFLPLNNISEIESALAALPLSSQTVLMERVSAHEIDRRECESILTMRAVVGKKWLGGCFQLLELRSALLCFPDVLADDFLVFLDIVLILF